MPNSSSRKIPFSPVLLRLVLVCVAPLFAAMANAAPNLSPGLFNKLSQITDLQAGEVIYVDFWASWCNPCRKSFPWMNAMQSKYGDAGLKILAVNVDTERELATRFLQEVVVSFDVYYDSKGQLATAFDLQGMPASFIIDSTGAIRFSHRGFFLEQTQEYENEIVSLIKK